MTANDLRFSVMFYKSMVRKIPVDSPWVVKGMNRDDDATESLFENCVGRRSMGVSLISPTEEREKNFGDFGACFTRA